MADVEVSELAKKLDKDLDKHFAETLEKNKDFKYKDGFTENIVDEAELIPAFMTGTPTQEQIDASPELQAMQALKYEQDDPHEAALAHKDDGNYHFQKKLYKSAILAYTEALKCQHDDATLKAVLYTNRAASNYYLGNKRSALNDAVWALKMKPDHMKAILRGANCCFDMEKYDECIEWCDKGLNIDAKESKLLEMKKKSLQLQKQKSRDERKQQAKIAKETKQRQELLHAIKIRNVRLQREDKLQPSTDSEADLLFRSGQDAKVYLDAEKILHWPTYFLYPQHNMSDFVEDMNEKDSLLDHLSLMFAPDNLPEWDTTHDYQLGNLKVYFEDRENGSLVHVHLDTQLKTVLSDKRFVVRGGCPAFLVVSKTTQFHSELLQKTPIEEF